MQEPMTQTTCDHCGELFKTSRQHPRRYCSIGCEEGTAPLPESDPASDGYHLYLQGEPQDLVGRSLVACALKRTCYSPEWHRAPADYHQSDIVTHDESEEVIVYETIQPIGEVLAFEDGHYVVGHEDMETGVTYTQRIPASKAIAMIRKGEWFTDG